MNASVPPSGLNWAMLSTKAAMPSSGYPARTAIIRSMSAATTTWNEYWMSPLSQDQNRNESCSTSRNGTKRGPSRVRMPIATLAHTTCVYTSRAAISRMRTLAITTTAAWLMAQMVPTTVAKPRTIPPREVMLLNAMPSCRKISASNAYTSSCICENAPPAPFSAAARACPCPTTIWMNVWLPNNAYGV